MALKYKHELREDLHRTAAVFVILTTLLLMIGSYWLGPICAEWLLEYLDEPAQQYHVSKSDYPLSPWSVRVQMITTVLPMLLSCLVGLLGLLLIDKARSKAIT